MLRVLLEGVASPSNVVKLVAPESLLASGVQERGSDHAGTVRFEGGAMTVAAAFDAAVLPGVGVVASGTLESCRGSTREEAESSDLKVGDMCGVWERVVAGVTAAAAKSRDKEAGVMMLCDELLDEFVRLEDDSANWVEKEWPGIGVASEGGSAAWTVADVNLSSSHDCHWLSSRKTTLRFGFER